MSDQKEKWSDWFDHDGSGMPLPLGTLVHRICDEPVDFMGGRECAPIKEIISPITESELACWDWSLPRIVYFGEIYTGTIVRIIRYRYRLPPGLLMLREIAADAPTPLKIKEVTA